MPHLLTWKLLNPQLSKELAEEGEIMAAALSLFTLDPRCSQEVSSVAQPTSLSSEHGEYAIHSLKPFSVWTSFYLMCQARSPDAQEMYVKQEIFTGHLLYS